MDLPPATRDEVFKGWLTYFEFASDAALLDTIKSMNAIINGEAENLSGIPDVLSREDRVFLLDVARTEMEIRQRLKQNKGT